MAPLADQIARTALHHYDRVLPGKGKPRETEWTVYAAIVAVRGGAHLWVVSCATGTKCCALHNSAALRDSNSAAACWSILHDSHAEVLARRGLQRVLWDEVLAWRRRRSDRDDSLQSKLNENLQSLLVEVPVAASPQEALGEEKKKSSNCKPTTRFQLDPDVELHMYISDSPCGDASIYAVRPSKKYAEDEAAIYKDAKNPQLSTTEPQQHQFTGAKVIASRRTQVAVRDCGGPVLETRLTSAPSSSNDNTATSAADVKLVREGEQQLTGKLRTKSGRSNLDADRRSTSMSCSDKLVRYSVLGWQGALLSSLLEEPIRITGIVVGCDPRACDWPIDEEYRAAGKTVEMTAPCAQLGALRRAIPDRVKAVKETLLQTIEKDATPEVLAFANKILVPQVSISNCTFPRGKAITETETAQIVAATKKRKRDDNKETSVKAPSPCGLSINWQHYQQQKQQQEHLDGAIIVASDADVELTVGARGIRHGKKPKSPADYIALQSRLCRKAMMERARTVVGSSSAVDDDARHTEPNANSATSTPVSCVPDFCKFKRDHGCSTYREIRRLILNHGPLAGWLTSTE